jgi:hypothetical protein
MPFHCLSLDNMQSANLMSPPQGHDQAVLLRLPGACMGSLESSVGENSLYEKSTGILILA